MDGGVVEIGGRRTSIEIDDKAGPPRAWVAFLATLIAGAVALLFIVLTVVPDRDPPARPHSVAELARVEKKNLREDIARLTEQRDALAQERRRLVREVSSLSR